MKTVFAFLLLSIPAVAEPLAERVAALQAQGATSALDIRVALCRPSEPVTVTNQVVTAKPAAQIAWERNAAAEIEAFVEAVTGDRRNALKRIAALDSAQMLAAVRAGKKAQPGKREDIMDKSDSLVLFYLDAQRKGYPWPLPDDFGQETTTAAVVTTVPGKAWWQREGLKSPPTIDQISNLMK